MRVKYNYGDIYKEYPLEEGRPYIFEDGSIIQVHNIYNKTPEFMYKSDVLFIDPPWNLGNLNTFYLKAEQEERIESFKEFYTRLFTVIKDINPKMCFVEVGKEHLADFIIQMRKIFKYVTFYNSTYYHSKDKLCYVIQGSSKRRNYKLDGMDEQHIIEWVCKNIEYEYIGDLCMGQGLVGYYSNMYGKKFVGTELNHKRLSVLIKRIQEGKLNVK
jgi:hypothetical protein